MSDLKNYKLSNPDKSPSCPKHQSKIARSKDWRRKRYGQEYYIEKLASIVKVNLVSFIFFIFFLSKLYFLVAIHIAFFALMRNFIMWQKAVIYIHIISYFISSERCKTFFHASFVTFLLQSTLWISCKAYKFWISKQAATHFSISSQFSTKEKWNNNKILYTKMHFQIRYKILQKTI